LVAIEDVTQPRTLEREKDEILWEKDELPRSPSGETRASESLARLRQREPRSHRTE